MVPLSDESWVTSAISPPSPNSKSSEHRASVGVVVAEGAVVVGAVLVVVADGVAVHAVAKAIRNVDERILGGTREG